MFSILSYIYILYDHLKIYGNMSIHRTGQTDNIWENWNNKVDQYH